MKDINYYINKIEDLINNNDYSISLISAVSLIIDEAVEVVMRLKMILRKDLIIGGSISIMLDEYCDFLLEKISNELIVNKNDFINKYENVLLYINSELNVSDNLIDRLADKKLASNCKKWKQLNEEFKIIK